MKFQISRITSFALGLLIIFISSVAAAQDKEPDIRLITEYKTGEPAITFYWICPNYIQAEYNTAVELEEKAGQDFKKIAAVGNGIYSITLPYDKNRKAQSYTFRLNVKNSFSTSPYLSQELTVNYSSKGEAAKKSPPVSKKITLKAENVEIQGEKYTRLSWNKITGAKAYQVYYSKTEGNELIPYPLIPVLSDNIYFIDMPYYLMIYAVQAVDDNENIVGTLSNQVKVSPKK